MDMMRAFRAFSGKAYGLAHRFAAPGGFANPHPPRSKRVRASPWNLVRKWRTPSERRGRE